MSTAKFNQWLNSDGTENYKCRAWVTFDVSTGVPTINAAGNVSSITDGGVGDFTVNFTSAFSDANYTSVMMGRRNSATARPVLMAQRTSPYENLSGSSRFMTVIDVSGTQEDPLKMYYAAFR